MANLKDIRIRINSVSSTRQVTSAMKMVSAAKFRKAQGDIDHVRIFVSKLVEIVNFLGQSVDGIDKKFEGFRISSKGKVLLIPIASNKGLAGAFNNNIVKETFRLLKNDLKSEFENGEVDVLPIGKQVSKTFAARRIPMVGNYNDLLDATTQKAVYEVADRVIEDFFSKKYRKVIVIYNKFVNAAVQEVSSQQLLPLELSKKAADEGTFNDYIIEPDEATVLECLVPQAIKSLFYSMIVESAASEHGARMTSMQKATDNATELLGELQLQYNKARQGAITNELIEIVSGAEALKG